MKLKKKYYSNEQYIVMKGILISLPQLVLVNSLKG
jgi:hypothetical protein